MNQVKLSANQQLIVDAIKTGHAGVTLIAIATGLTKAAVSANIKPLRDKGVITTTEVDGVLLVKLAEGSPAPTVTAPTVAPKVAPGVVLIESITKLTRPRDIVLNLIKVSGMTKKAAKRVVYDHAYC